MEGCSKTVMNESKNMIKDLYEKQLKHAIEMVEKKMDMQIKLLKKLLDDEKISRKRTEQEFQNQLITDKFQGIIVEENDFHRRWKWKIMKFSLSNVCFVEAFSMNVIIINLLLLLVVFFFFFLVRGTDSP
ncbi:Triger factor/SurA peptide-binding domain-like protein [Dioscorea alata]|uniref:Triger factor/SurA peptide-binding domain-like protein n=1 Tax=Dioscorea alata TaxID=55571 RepID=A0ACB7W1U9_DIOAL|nr:Triger factor/SurA peptide-binding domain-like protein [Dioscorea alata]